MAGCGGDMAAAQQAQAQAQLAAALRARRARREAARGVRRGGWESALSLSEVPREKATSSAGAAKARPPLARNNALKRAELAAESWQAAMPAAAPKVESFPECDTIVVPDSDLEAVTPTLLKENIAPSMAASFSSNARIPKMTDVAKTSSKTTSLIPSDAKAFLGRTDVGENKERTMPDHVTNATKAKACSQSPSKSELQLSPSKIELQLAKKKDVFTKMDAETDFTTAVAAASAAATFSGTTESKDITTELAMEAAQKRATCSRLESGAVPMKKIATIEANGRLDSCCTHPSIAAPSGRGDGPRLGSDAIPVKEDLTIEVKEKSKTCCTHISTATPSERAKCPQRETKTIPIEDESMIETSKVTAHLSRTPRSKRIKLSHNADNIICIDASQDTSDAHISESSPPNSREMPALAAISVVANSGLEEILERQEVVSCSVCGHDLGQLEGEARQEHERVCKEDAALDRMQRRNYACPICDLDLACSLVNGSQLTKRLRHIRVCAKANGISDPRQFARIAKSTTLDSDDRDPDEECDEGDENFEALMDAIFDEDEEAKENAAAARENESNGRNAFSMLMQGSKTQGIGGRRAVPASQKNKAQQQKKRPRGGKMWRGSTGPHKYPPPQNQVPDCKGFIVDGFRYRFPKQKNTFFLTHFHADHYGGIPYRWDEGPIYCTPTTARLLAMRFKVSAACIHQIKIGGPPVRVQGVDVIALDANHCPGAAMFLFKVRKTGRMHLHTGDLRYDRQRIDLRKTLRIPAGFRLSTIFLDTTYLRPSCRFISQQQAISQAAERLSRVLRVESRNALTSAMGLDGKDKSILVVVGAYTIGKERFLWGLLRACFPDKEKIHVSPSKLRILKCLEDLQIDDLLRLTTDKSKARVHLTEMGKLNMPTLRGMLGNQFARVVALRPTGHAKRVHEAVSRDERVRIISVPYSEHSSFDELGHFIADAKAVTRGQALSFVPTVQSVGSKRGAGMADTRSELEALVRKV